ncbi:MAG: DUF4446 family protein [bacterium]|nr:DUF4446 family protein [bacterium]
MINWVIQNQFFILIGLFALTSAFFSVRLKTLNKKFKFLLGEGSGLENPDIQQELIRRVAKTEIKLEELEPRLETVEAISKISIQKTGFLRFNPFPGTGGDNSFVVVILDKEDNGFLLSSLYTREGVRIYAKQIYKGRPKHALSEEEMRVLEETINKQ